MTAPSGPGRHGAERGAERQLNMHALRAEATAEAHLTFDDEDDVR
jgi:hypothetical protein